MFIYSNSNILVIVLGCCSNIARLWIIVMVHARVVRKGLDPAVRRETKMQRNH